MSVMSIRIDSDRRKLLKAAAALQNTTISGLVATLIDQYLSTLKKDKAYSELTAALMKASEPSFKEWDNPEDEIYDNM